MTRKPEVYVCDSLEAQDKYIQWLQKKHLCMCRGMETRREREETEIVRGKELSDGGSSGIH